MSHPADISRAVLKSQHCLCSLRLPVGEGGLHPSGEIPWTVLACPQGLGLWDNLEDLFLLFQGKASRPTGNPHQVLHKHLDCKCIRHPRCWGCWWRFVSLISWRSGTDPARLDANSHFSTCLWVHSTLVALLVTVSQWLQALSCNRTESYQFLLIRLKNFSHAMWLTALILPTKRRFPAAFGGKKKKKIQFFSNEKV